VQGLEAKPIVRAIRAGDLLQDRSYRPSAFAQFEVVDGEVGDRARLSAS
jgi:hypothetical protein